MAELTISAQDIQGAIESYVSSFEADSGREEVGTVIDTGDGIAHVEGLPSAMTQELLEFAGGVLGVALNLDEHSIGAVILGESDKIAEGQQVRRTAGAERSLRTLSAKSTSEISRLTLLQQHHSNQEQTDYDVHNDEKNQHGWNKTFAPPERQKLRIWCGGGDLNPYALRR